MSHFRKLTLRCWMSFHYRDYLKRMNQWKEPVSY